jgi:hypothetical protein
MLQVLRRKGRKGQPPTYLPTIHKKDSLKKNLILHVPAGKIKNKASVSPHADVGAFQAQSTDHRSYIYYRLNVMLRNVSSAYCGLNIVSRIGSKPMDFALPQYIS